MNEFLIDIFDAIFEGTESLNPTLMAMIPFFVLIATYLLGYIVSIIKRGTKNANNRRIKNNASTTTRTESDENQSKN